ncbi:galectin-9-like [Rhinophrynus dorsalis]
MSFGPIYNPPVPFTTPFSHGLRDGSVVVVNGTILPSGDRFSVNFQCGHSSNDDIAFHFNPRFIDGGIVVCNTKERQNWGKEENKREMPFHRGQPFELCIHVSNHSYKVSVNRNHFVEYHHRIPLQRVNTLTVNGCVSLSCVNIQAQGAGFPSQQFPSGPMFNPAFPQQPAFTPPQHAPGNAFNPHQFPSAPFQAPNYAIPYHANIYGGLFPSKTIVIRGAVTGHPKRFHINLKFSGGTALHFNPRFDERAIVRNSFLNNSWGKEERQLPSCGMCFAPGQSFVIEIRCDHHAFMVNVNGVHVCEFHHRVHNLQQIDTLQIEGDVVLQHVQI